MSLDSFKTQLENYRFAHINGKGYILAESTSAPNQSSEQYQSSDFSTSSSLSQETQAPAQARMQPQSQFPNPAIDAQIDRYLDLISRFENCCERTCFYGHLTGSAWIVSPSSSVGGNEPKILLTHHRKLNKWLQLGGHADGDTDIKRVALREAQEESGIASFLFLQEGIFDLDIHEIPATANEPAHLHFDCRYLLQAQSEDISCSEESLDLQWFRPNEILNDLVVDESVVRLVKKWQAWLQQSDSPLPC